MAFNYLLNNSNHNIYPIFQDSTTTNFTNHSRFNNLS